MMPAAVILRGNFLSNEQVKTSRRILIIKMSSLGDILHALPVVRCLKEGLRATIDWVAQPEYVELVKCFPDVSRVIPFPRRDFWRHFGEFRADLRESKYDYIIDLQGLIKSATVALLARGRKRIGPSFSREGSRLAYHAVVGPVRRDRHAVDELMDVVRYFALEVPHVLEFPAAFPKTQRPEPSPRVAIIPCSRWKTKNWPLERFVEVARALRARAKATLFLVGSPADSGTCADIAAGAGEGIVNLCGRTSLVELGSLLQEMDLAVSVDSGPMHMAAAVGVPVLAVFGATDPRRTGPYGSRHRVITADHLSCRPCRSENCARRDLACLRDLPADRVIAAALEMLGR